MRWRGRRVPFDRVDGPERLSGDWWRDGYRRDYWRCEGEGSEFLLFLEHRVRAGASGAGGSGSTTPDAAGPDAAGPDAGAPNEGAGRWCVQGWYD
jgi:hypothetical protein